jgi:hypothetical protein
MQILSINGKNPSYFQASRKIYFTAGAARDMVRVSTPAKHIQTVHAAAIDIRPPVSS